MVDPCKHDTLDIDAMRDAIRTAYHAADPELVADGIRWYSDAADMIRADAERFGVPFSTAASVYAACSINASWAANITNARRWLAYATGQQSRPSGLAQVAIRCERAISVRPETFEDAWNVTLGNADARGSKVASFVSNFHGHADYVTIDRWAMVGAGVASLVPNTNARKVNTPMPCPRHAKAPKGLKYARIADAYRDVARELGIAARDLQAAVWVGVRGRAN